MELKVNNKERTYLKGCAGTARFAWNWGLAERIKRFNEKTDKERFTNAIAQHRELNKLKKTDFSWMYDYSKCILQESLRDLETGFKNFWKNRKERTTGKTTRYVGFPKFKKKGKCKESFRLTGIIKVFPEQKVIQLPRLGKLRVKGTPKLSTTTQILSATISRTADRWYVALTVKEEVPEPPTNEGRLIALDKGISVFSATSLELPIPPPNFLLRHMRKLRRISKPLSRKKPGSNNRKKAAQMLAQFHRKIKHIRQDFLHKLTTYLAKNYSIIVVEDLWIQGLIKNKD